MAYPQGVPSTGTRQTPGPWQPLGLPLGSRDRKRYRPHPLPMAWLEAHPDPETGNVSVHRIAHDVAPATRKHSCPVVRTGPSTIVRQIHPVYLAVADWLPAAAG